MESDNIGNNLYEEIIKMIHQLNQSSPESLNGIVHECNDLIAENEENKKLILLKKYLNKYVDLDPILKDVINNIELEECSYERLDFIISAITVLVFKGNNGNELRIRRMAYGDYETPDCKISYSIDGDEYIEIGSDEEFYGDAREDFKKMYKCLNLSTIKLKTFILMIETIFISEYENWRYKD